MHRRLSNGRCATKLLCIPSLQQQAHTMVHTASRTVLILGAHGRFGAAAAEAFWSAGWRVVAQARRGELAIPLSDTAGLAQAAAGASAVVYAANPLYTDWDTQMLPLARAGMDVAQRLGALFMLPGNVEWPRRAHASAA